MKSRSIFFASVIVLALTLPSLAQEDKLGKVGFPTSCDPKVQAQFERGVVMLHSFWFSATEKTFRDVLVQDPTCTQLRRAAPRQAGPVCRATLCEHRAGGAACAAYAFAHLYPPWRLGRLGCDQSPCERGGEKGWRT